MNIIQIGCNNCEDHVFDFVSTNRDSISNFLVIDALPKCVEIASQKYNFLGDRLIAVQCAVAPENGILKFFYPTTDDCSAHSSLLKNHVNNHHHKDLNYFFIPTLDINTIFNFFFNNVERLYVDIEGLDVVTILNLDFEKNKPKYIEYEFYHADGTFSYNKNSDKLLSLLQSHNYSLEQSGYNVIAKLNS